MSNPWRRGELRNLERLRGERTSWNGSYLEGERDTEREGRREMEGEMEWKFPKVELTMSPRIKDHGMDYCKKKKKKLSFPLGRCNPALWHMAWWAEHRVLSVLIYSLAGCPGWESRVHLLLHLWVYQGIYRVSLDSCLLPGEWSFWLVKTDRVRGLRPEVWEGLYFKDSTRVRLNSNRVRGSGLANGRESGVSGW